MKKSISLAIISLLAIFSLVACSGTNNKVSQEANAKTESETQTEAPTTEVVEVFVPDYSKFNLDNMKTMGDIFAFRFEEGQGNYQDSVTENKFIAVLNINNIYYRAIADITKDVSDTLMQCDFSERDSKIKELIYPLPIKTLENLNDKIPSQDELNKLIGKTGKELFDDGWTYMYFNVEDVSAGLYHGDYLFDVVFEYEGEPMKNSDDIDFYETYKDFKVKSIKYTDIGNATNVEE